MNYWRRKQLQEWAEQTGLIKHPLVKRFLSSPMLQDDPEWEERITNLLRIRMSVAVPEPHPFLPVPEQAGEIGPWVSPGLVIGGKGPAESFRDPVKSFLQHKGFFGPSGPMSRLSSERGWPLQDRQNSLYHPKGARLTTNFFRLSSFSASLSTASAVSGLDRLDDRWA